MPVKDSQFLGIPFISPTTPSQKTIICKASGKLTLGGEEPEDYDLQLGQLFPLLTRAGVWTRLQHLSYLGPLQSSDDDEIEEHLAQAVRAFQGIEGLPQSGQLDDATYAKLQERHGS